MEYFPQIINEIECRTFRELKSWYRIEWNGGGWVARSCSLRTAYPLMKLIIFFGGRWKELSRLYRGIPTICGVRDLLQRESTHTKNWKRFQ